MSDGEALRLGVDPRSAEVGFQRYDQAAEQSIKRTEELAAAVAQYEQTLRHAIPELEAFVEGVAEGMQAEAELMMKTEALSVSTRDLETRYAGANAGALSSVQGLGRLNQALTSMARQAIGTSPVVAQLTNVVGTFALGTATTTAVLGGLAAIALGYRTLTRDAREAAEAQEAVQARLDALVAGQGPGTGVGDLMSARFNLSALQTEMAQIRERIAFQEQMGLPTGALRKRLGEVAWESSLAREAVRAATGDTATVLPGLDVSAPSKASLSREATKQAREMVQAWIDTQRNNSAFKLEDRLRPWQNQLAYQGGGLDGIVNAERAFEGIERRVEQLRDAEDQLAQRRERANASLVIGLANVGRAYGGVADQVLNLAAATLSLSRLPGFGEGETPGGKSYLGLTTDEWRGYGSAALTGIGYGVSTGSPAMGGLGGAASGFAIAGPGGALVGAVTGIVSGLFEQGERAREAAALWKMAMEDYSLLFDELSPEQQREQQNRRSFMQASGGLTPEQVNALLGSGANSYMLEQTTGLSRAQLEELNHWYLENAKQAKELAAAEQELNHIRQGSLNNPSGIRLSLYQWMAAGVTEGIDDVWTPGKAGKGKSGSVTINVTVNGATDPRETARVVMGEINRQAKLGGPDPFTLETR